MTRSLTTTLALAACLAAGAADDPFLSTRLEIQRAIKTGNEYLRSKQAPDGHWGDPQMPALTALPLMAWAGDPARDTAAAPPDHIERAYRWLLACQKDDGGVYQEGLSVYNTAISLTALLAAEREAFEPAIVRARAYLVKQQFNLDRPGEPDNPSDGGIGYGSDKSRSDLSNTHIALEAIALSRKVIADARHGDQPDLDWDAAIQFVTRCQNLEESNDQEWASDDPANKGGFIYTPGQSKAGEQKLPDGRTALRSYGSMSYAGLLSLVYAKVGADDPRVTAVRDWLARNYSVEENPGLGQQGLYYYYHVMSKALTAANVGKLALPGDKTADWRNDLATTLLASQREDGSWVNTNSRWWENDPALVTCYAVLTLQQLHRAASVR